MADEEPDRADDPWLTLAEIGEELRMSPATIRSWISKGTLRAMRAGQRKWLVRRSELDRMLRGDDFENSPSPPPDSPAPGHRRPPRRFPNSITPPSGRPSALGEEEVDREQWLGVAEWEWLAALEASRMAPPDAWFAGRLQHIAEAAARKAGALEPFDDGDEMRWEAEPIVDSFTLSYELRPRGNRPGPAKLWKEFDRAVDRLGVAMQDGTAGAIRRALEELSLTLHDIADSLERYRGRYGKWIERPPRTSTKSTKSRPPGASGATEPTVS